MKLSKKIIAEADVVLEIGNASHAELLFGPIVRNKINAHFQINGFYSFINVENGVEQKVLLIPTEVRS